MDFQKIKDSPEDLLIDGGLESNDISFEWTKQNEDLGRINQSFPIHKIDETLKERDLEIEFRVIANSLPQFKMFARF